MADDTEKPEVPVVQPVPQPRARDEKNRKETDNPGEGAYMFSDWALI